MSVVETLDVQPGVSGLDAWIAVDQSILDAIPCAIYVFRADGTLLRFNRKAAELCGQTPERFEPPQWLCDAGKADGSPIEAVLQSGEPVYGWKIAVRRPDGTGSAAVASAQPLKDRSGCLAGAVGSFQEIAGESSGAEAGSNPSPSADHGLDRQRSAELAQRQLVAIVESSTDAIISKDLTGKVISWNRGAESLFGYVSDEMIGQSIEVIIPAERRNEEKRILDSIRRGEPIKHFETVRRRKDGSEVHISLNISPVTDANGVIVGASKIARDISESKRVEEMLARHAQEQAALYAFTDRLHRTHSLEEIHRAAIDTIMLALRCERASILMRDASDKMRFVAWRGLSDSYRQAVDGHSPWAADESSPQPICMDDIESSKLPQPLKAIVRKEGIGALAFFPLVTGGRLIGKFMAYYDAPHEFRTAEIELAITIARQLCFGVERLQNDTLLRANEERLRIATQAGKVGVWEWDIQSNSVSWTDAVYVIHGVEKGRFGGTLEAFASLVHPDDSERVANAINLSLREDAPYELEFRIVKPNGIQAWLYTHAVLLREKGVPVRMLGATLDVTERKRADAHRDLLVAELSHRVKNTLATVISIARQSFAKDIPFEEARKSFNGRIHALAQTHSRLAEENWSGTSLATIILDELAPYRNDDGGNVNVHGPAISLNPKYAVILGMAVHELATNAAKYGALTAKSGAVEVSWTTSSKDRLRIVWTETGGPTVVTPKRSGFGRLLLERALTSDLRGEVRLNFREAGMQCEIDIPLERGTGIST